MPGEWTVIGHGAVRTEEIAAVVISEYDTGDIGLDFKSHTGDVLHTLWCESMEEARLKLAEFVMDDALRLAQEDSGDNISEWADYYDKLRGNGTNPYPTINPYNNPITWSNTTSNATVQFDEISDYIKIISNQAGN